MTIVINFIPIHLYKKIKNKKYQKFLRKKKSNIINPFSKHIWIFFLPGLDFGAIITLLYLRGISTSFSFEAKLI